ncbi:BamA/OMP85 family outer membrane protein [Phnomibacter sp. MR]|uniref:BamA/OMP85 family outer membrane protein n=1 Tax=Phnomibacter sp. MR TaxID=3042318 RepID=UPI003A7FD3FF
MSFNKYWHCLLAVLMMFGAVAVQAQDTTAVSVDPELENIFSQKSPKEYIVGSVVVSGNKYFDNALLLSIANLNVGDKIVIPGGDNFSRTINNLWSQNYFSNVTIYITRLEKPNKLHLEIEVQERPRLQKFAFNGVKKSDVEELQTKSGLVAGRIITENNKQLAIDAIVKYYQEKGFRNIDVKVAEVPSATVPNASDLVFDINKGKKVKVGDIYIGGNTEVPELRVKRQMKGTKETTRITLYPAKDTPLLAEKETVSIDKILENQGFLQPTVIKNNLDPYFRFKLFSSAKFDAKKYEEDREKILDYYNTLGYRDARIVKDTIYDNSKGNLNVELMMSEGRQYYFGKMVFRGNTKFSDSLLQVLIGINKGDIYNKETLDKALGKQMSADGGTDISALYMDDGYLFFRAEASETAVYNDTIDHEIRLFEGPQATIKNINISGNEKTKEYVIRRELRTIPGEKFSRTDLIRSQREIANLNFFNQETIGINPVPDMSDGTVDINYSVEEKSSDQLELSAGWGGGIGLTGTLGVTFNNFSIKNILKRATWDPLPSGDGQKLSLRLQSNGRAFRSYNFSFTEPWLGGKKRNSFTVSVFDTKFSNAYNFLTGQYERTPSSFIKTTGASVALGRQLKWPDDFFSLLTSVSYSRYTLKDYQFFEDFRNGISNNLSFKIALQRSSIDQPLFPRSGSSFTASLQFTPPWSVWGKSKVYDTPEDRYKLIEFHKWRFNGEWYVPLSRPHGAERNKQLVLKLAAKYGFIGRYNKDLEISPFERFQVGDAGLSNQFALIGFDVVAHRGYPVYQTSDPKINPDQQGASRYFTIFNKYVAEVRYPLSLNPSSTIFALGFFEAANGWYSMKDYNPFKLRRSVGLGMRFFLPMFGLLGFDYGIGLDRLTPGNGIKDATRFTFMLGFEPE